MASVENTPNAQPAYITAPGSPHLEGGYTEVEHVDSAPSDEYVDNVPTIEAAPEVEAVGLADFDAIMETDDLDAQKIFLPAPHKGYIVARPLTMEETARLRKESKRKLRDGKGKVIGETIDETVSNQVLLRLSLIEPVWTAEQIKRLWSKNAKLMLTIMRELSKLSGLLEDDLDQDDPEALAEAKAEFRS